jgi:integrase
MPADFGKELEYSSLVAMLLWNGLAPDTRAGYSSATHSWESFCVLEGVTPYPVQKTALAEWIARRAFGTPTMRQVKPNTLSNYLSALRSRHVDFGFSIEVFEDPFIKRLLAGAKSLFPQKCKDKLPITRDILAQIVTSGTSKKDINIDAAFTLAFAGFLRMGEITHTATELKSKAFTHTKATRGDITIARDQSSMVFHLKRSKMDTSHAGVRINIAAIPGDPLCPVAAMIRLHNRDPKPDSAPLFAVNTKAFSKEAVLAILKRRLIEAGIRPDDYTNHSFRKGAAQHARDCGFAEDQLMPLGRWTSNTVKRYYKDSEASLLKLNDHFQRGIPLLDRGAKSI